MQNLEKISDSRIFIQATGIIVISMSSLSMGLAQPSSLFMDKRIQSANLLLENINQVQMQAQLLHSNTENIIAQANCLKGATSKFEIKTPIIEYSTKMNSIEQAAAKKQYQLDINEFAEHAKAYNQHLQDFQKLVGECHSSNQALAAVLQKYQLHVTQFHLPMPPIKPPHICARLQANVGDLSSVARQMMGDQLRVMEAEAKLGQEEEGLRLASNAVPNLQTKAILTAQRAEGEVQLSSEFGHLKEEYEMLKIEKDTIDGAKTADAGITQTKISGKVIKH